MSCFNISDTKLPVLHASYIKLDDPRRAIEERRRLLGRNLAIDGRVRPEPVAVAFDAVDCGMLRVGARGELLLAAHLIF